MGRLRRSRSRSIRDVRAGARSPLASGASVLATQTVGSQTYDAVIATNTGGRNVHFSTDEVMADNNLLWQAIDYAVNGPGVRRRTASRQPRPRAVRDPRSGHIRRDVADPRGLDVLELSVDLHLCDLPAAPNAEPPEPLKPR